MTHKARNISEIRPEESSREKGRNIYKATEVFVHLKGPQLGYKLCRRILNSSAYGLTIESCNEAFFVHAAAMLFLSATKTITVPKFYIFRKWQASMAVPC